MDCNLDDVTKPPILFFGDCFVGPIPEIMDDELPHYSVLIYGVGGYGTDQIFLRFRREVEKFASKNPQFLIGVLLKDMDRSLLSFRDT